MLKNNIEFKELSDNDIDKIALFTAKGMNLGVYFKSFDQTLDYAKYFTYHEILDSSDYLTAYIDGEFVGALFYSLPNKPKLKLSKDKKEYHDKYLKQSIKENEEEATLYPRTINELKKEYNLSEYDLEMTLFVVDPERLHEGIGSYIFDEFTKKYKGKKAYLFTDKYCKYGFYDKKGFTKIAEKNIVFYNDGDVPECIMLYTKIL